MNYQHNIEDDLCEAGSSPKQLFAMGEVRFPKCRFCQILFGLNILQMGYILKWCRFISFYSLGIPNKYTENGCARHPLCLTALATSKVN
jgi:hypothetical protein